MTWTGGASNSTVKRRSVVQHRVALQDEVPEGGSNHAYPTRQPISRMDREVHWMAESLWIPGIEVNYGVRERNDI